MKNKTIFAFLATFLTFSQPVSASEITETYNTGDTLTASKMGSIKSAVNDNNARILFLENEFTLSDLVCSTGEIAKFDGNNWICSSDVANGSDTLTNLACTSGQIVKFNGTQWICAEDNDTDEESLGDLPCGAGQVAKFDGVQWNCANDDAATSSQIEQVASGVVEQRVYGDGSAGSEVISSVTSWTDPLPSLTVSNFQFSSFQVQAGGELTVNSGTVIRCVGDVTIDGNLLVDTYAEGGNNAFLTSAGISPAASGLTRRAAGLPRYVQVNGGEPRPDTTPTSHSSVSGGQGGLGIDDLALVAGAGLRHLGPNGGGGGTGWQQSGGAGGGTLTILAKGTITVSGSIQANGEDAPAGAGGGGGAGIVILASQTAIDISGGTVTAAGGNGGDSTDMAAAGGGGGGGIVHLMAPSLIGDSNVSIPAGAAGSSLGALTNVVTVFSGGGGGGGSGGRGGRGGSVQANSTGINDPFSAHDGTLYVTQIDPTNQLF